jgi:hypothetical protein
MATTLLLTHDPRYDRATLLGQLVSPYGNMNTSLLLRQTLANLLYQGFMHLKVETDEEKKND